MCYILFLHFFRLLVIVHGSRLIFLAIEQAGKVRRRLVLSVISPKDEKYFYDFVSMIVV